MNLHDYQANAKRTINPALSAEAQMHAMALGIFVELGEAFNIVKKWLYQNDSLSQAQLADELGDVCWYLANLATAFDLPLVLVSTGTAAPTEDIVFPLMSAAAQHAADLMMVVQTAAGNKAAWGLGRPSVPLASQVSQGVNMILTTVNWLAHNMLDESVLSIMKQNIAKLKLRYPDGFSK